MSNYEKPEGCRAAVTSNWEPTRLGHKLTARMVCGDRNNTVEDAFSREIFGINTEYNANQTRARVNEQITEVLGAMCLGCPYNTVTAESSS